MEIIIIASALFGIMIGWVLGYLIKKAEIKDSRALVSKVNELTQKLAEAEKQRDCERTQSVYWFNEYERERNKHYREMSELHNQTDHFASKGIEMFNEMRRLKSECSEAVKYAMKMSHPDNNGNAEDFMKFRKLYKKITE